MRLFKLLALLAVALAAPGWAQEDPDEGWKDLPGAAKPNPPPAPPVPGPEMREPVLPTPAPSREGYSAAPRATLVQPRPVLEPNTISMFGARSLGFLNRGEMIYLGFPLLGIRAAIGLTIASIWGLASTPFTP